MVGSWVQPKVTCTAGQPSYSAFWVGLGGFSTDAQALEQIGTESNCDARGRPVYAAWYEIVPAPSIPIAMKIAPGDRLTAAVLVQGTQVTLQLTNTTRRVRTTRRVTVAQPDLTSAEWIAEAPSSCSSLGRLPDAAACELRLGLVHPCGRDRRRPRRDDHRPGLAGDADRAGRARPRRRRPEFTGMLSTPALRRRAGTVLGRRPRLRRCLASRVRLGKR